MKNDKNIVNKIVTDFSIILGKKVANDDTTVVINKLLSYLCDESYEKVVEGWILEKEKLFILFEYYFDERNTEKTDFIVSVLNKYYTGYLKEVFKESISKEDYELCSKLKFYV